MRVRDKTMRRFGPKDPDDDTIGHECPACGVPFRAADYTTLVPLGPGGDLDERERARLGLPYDPVHTEVHWACATGEELTPPEGWDEG